MQRQTLDSFWSKVRRGGANQCWPWLGSVSVYGYGRLRWNYKTVHAHRVAAWAAGMADMVGPSHYRKGSGFVLHICDNKVCCNPRHLFVGSLLDNSHDARSKGRLTPRHGVLNTQAKLTPRQVRAIRHAVEKGATHAATARKFKVSPTQVTRIVNYQRWRNI